MLYENPIIFENLALIFCESGKVLTESTDKVSRREASIWKQVRQVCSLSPPLLSLYSNVSLLSKQFLLRWRWFHCYHYADSDTRIKNASLFLKYSNLTPTTYISLISYYLRIMFIKIIVRFFIIWHINGEKYERVSTKCYVYLKPCL